MSYDTKMAIVVRRDLRNAKGEKVKTGKLMAQSGHAATKWLQKRLRLEPSAFGSYGPDDPRQFTCDLSPAETNWLFSPTYAKVVLGAANENELMLLVAKATEIDIAAELIIDLGLTEFDGKQTVTCAAIGPATVAQVDLVTGHLKPY